MANKVNITAGLFTAYSYESITVANTAIGLSNTLTSANEKAKRVVITVETARLRFRYDGTAPTSTEGHLLSPNDKLTLIGSDNIANFKAIRTGDTSSVIKVTYEN